MSKHRSTRIHNHDDSNKYSRSYDRQYEIQKLARSLVMTRGDRKWESVRTLRQLEEVRKIVQYEFLDPSLPNCESDATEDGEITLRILLFNHWTKQYKKLRNVASFRCLKSAKIVNAI